MSQLTATLSQYWSKIQETLFPQLEEQLDPLTEKQQQLVTTLELVRIEQFLPDYRGCEGRPQKTRSAIARSFVAKMIYNNDTTTALIERLKTDKNPRGNKELKEAIEAETKARKILNWEPAGETRYNVRSTAERANSRLKDEFGACKVRVRGHCKVACHLMFGVLVLAADQLMNLVV